MKKTGKSGLGHLKKIEKQDRQIIARKAQVERMGQTRTMQKPRRRCG